MTAHRDQHGLTLAQIRALLDADPDSAGDGPLDPDSTLNRVTARYGSKAVGEALRPESTADGRPAHRQQ